MILGVGVDIVEVARFQSWTKASQQRLSRVFTEQELNDCQRNNNAYDAEKLAARFAAKEAFFKALSATLINLKKTQQTFSLLRLCSAVAVTTPVWGVPVLIVDWKALEKIIHQPLPILTVHLSLSHERSHAIAYVLIELNEEK